MRKRLRQGQVHRVPFPIGDWPERQDDLGRMQAAESAANEQRAAYRRWEAAPALRWLRTRGPKARARLHSGLRVLLGPLYLQIGPIDALLGGCMPGTVPANAHFFTDHDRIHVMAQY